MNEKFLKPYNPKETEDKIYQKWEESGYFNPDKMIADNLVKHDADKFSIVLPPPNVTGELHIGHAAMLAIEDIVVRYQRMQGKKTLWVPGTDHAAIATQSKVEKILEKEGKRKTDLGREEFLKEVNDFAQKSHDTIISQLKAMGASLDWSREAFTLDEQRHVAVNEAFKRMYEDGLIYRAEKIVNWDPKGQTVISDDEVIYEERKAKFYTFKYDSNFPISISTTRPETKFGDTAVAVHPDDKRYQDFIGKEFEADFVGEKLKIKIIADTNVEPEFGTGALGVTPAHSHIDFEMGEKNNLPIKKVINEFAKMETSSELVNGKKVLEAREIVVNWLKENNLLEKEEEITQNVSTAERTGAIIEPLPKTQWWIDVNKEFEIKNSNIKGIENGEKVTLKRLMIQVVENGQTEIIPDRFEKVYYHWINNLHDWCISRQIWYGHRIPIWYKENETKFSATSPGEGWKQDDDSLDTWFSSGLWTFSTLGWPDNTDDLKNYHPTDLLETGYDIIFFWVARMILMSTYLLGDIPFKTVYLHGIVRDAKGRKMSKTLNNGIDPLELIENYGADAVRMSLIVGVGPGNDTNMSEDKIRAYKKFTNKIWNASRFVIEKTEDLNEDGIENLTARDQQYINEFHNFLEEVTKEIEEYKLYLASEKTYHYFWHTFADIIIEECKKSIIEGTDEPLDSARGKEKISAQKTLKYLLVNQLKILHPFIPFVTEEIWSLLPYNKDTDLLMVTKWPDKNQK
jgi:valyl-tRNA synthetase